MEKAAETLKDVLELQGALDLDPSTREMCLEPLVELPGVAGRGFGRVGLVVVGEPSRMRGGKDHTHTNDDNNDDALVCQSFFFKVVVEVIGVRLD